MTVREVMKKCSKMMAGLNVRREAHIFSLSTKQRKEKSQFPIMAEIFREVLLTVF